MGLNKISSLEHLQVIGRFESLRNILLSEAYCEHLQKPLAYWALPTDRRLPLAFLGRSLKDLLETPFAELSKTPGIGQKKICSFVRLLARAANTDPADLPMEVVTISQDGSSAQVEGNGSGSDDLFDQGAGRVQRYSAPYAAAFFPFVGPRRRSPLPAFGLCLECGLGELELPDRERRPYPEKVAIEVDTLPQ